MIEAMACSTPVIAYPLGSVPEVVQESVTGFIGPDLEGAVRAVTRLGEIDRRKCRRYFEQHFNAERMARDYLTIYQRRAQVRPGEANSIPSSVVKVRLPCCAPKNPVAQRSLTGSSKEPRRFMPMCPLQIFPCA
jgi:hypothetical protein